MESIPSPRIKIFLSRREGEDTSYYTVNEVCQKYQGIVLEDYRFNTPSNFQKQTLEECALEDDIIVFLITGGEPSERQSLDDPRLKEFLQRGGKIWVFYKLLEKKQSDFQKGKDGPDRWYYERTDPKMHPNDDYVVSDYFGVDEKGYNQSLYAQFDRQLSSYVNSRGSQQDVADGSPNSEASDVSDKGTAIHWRWLLAVIIILALFFLFMAGRPHINRFFHPEGSPIIGVDSSLVIGSDIKEGSIHVNSGPTNGNHSVDSVTSKAFGTQKTTSSKKISIRRGDNKFSDAYKQEHKFVYFEYSAKDLSSRQINKLGLITPGFNITEDATQALWRVKIDAYAKEHPAGNSSGCYFAYVYANVTICNTVSDEILFQGDISTPASKTSGIKGGSYNSFDEAVDKAYFEASKIIVELIKQKIDE